MINAKIIREVQIFLHKEAVQVVITGKGTEVTALSGKLTEEECNRLISIIISRDKNIVCSITENSTIEIQYSGEMVYDDSEYFKMRKL